MRGDDGRDREGEDPFEYPMRSGDGDPPDDGREGEDRDGSSTDETTDGDRDADGDDGSSPEGPIGLLVDAARTAASTPGLFWSGFGVALGPLAAAVALPSAWSLAGDLTVVVLQATGRTSTEPFGGVSVPEASLLVGRVALFLVFATGVVAVAWTLVGTPATALVARVVWSDDATWRGRLAWLAGSLPSMLVAGLLRRVAALCAVAVVVPTLLAAYFGVGTLLEAVAYGLGVYRLHPMAAVAVPALVLATAVGLAWVGAAAVGFVDVAAAGALIAGDRPPTGDRSETPTGTDAPGARDDRSVVDGVRDGVRFAALAPRHALAHGGVALGALAVPALLAGGVVALVGSARSTVDAATLGVGAVAFLAVATVSVTVAAVYRVRAFEADVASRLDGTGVRD